MPRTIADYRIGGVPIWRIVPDDWEGLMRVPDEVLKSVVFLGRKEFDPKTKLERKVLGGTAFFVTMDVGYGANLFCLVTARHVARQLEHGEFFIRANTRYGKSEDYFVDAGVEANWIFHPTDDSVDVAVMLWGAPPEVVFAGIPENMFLPQKKIAQKRIGIGDEIFVPGLSSFHTGKGLNEPIIRSGHIAMMPKERIPVRKWHPDGMEGYLIEGRSIGGFSGSRVFVRRSIEVQPTENSGAPPLAAGAIFWLGLMHGHRDVTEDDVDAVISAKSGDPEQAINAGIAIITPCHKILEVLHHPEIRKSAESGVDYLLSEHTALMDGSSPNHVKRGSERNAAVVVTLKAAASASPSGGTSALKQLREITPKNDSAFSDKRTEAPSAATPDNPSHKEDFTRLLGAAAKSNKSAS